MKKFLHSFLSVLILIALFASNAFAAVPDPGDDFYYLDQVGVMSSKTKSMLYENGEAVFRLRAVVGKISGYKIVR